MKRSNLITLSVLLIMIAASVAFYLYREASSARDVDTGRQDESSRVTEDTEPAADTAPETEPESETESETEPEESDDTTTEPAPETDPAPVETAPPIEALSVGSLFIGDSRTVGIMEYSGIADADFFCNVGMSVFNAQKERISVPKVGKVTLSELLSNRKYGKIYLMLGINELGYNLNSILNRYNELIEYVRANQPEAVIVIQANLHVSAKRSASDDYINNPAIDRLNGELEGLADGDSIIYIDANPLFDDESGNLSEDKTFDNVHLYAKYYAYWGEWICKETAKYIGEG